MLQVAQSLKNEENDIKKSLGTGTVKSEALSDRDAGFCSGDETDLDLEYHSPTETSRDSTDTKDSLETFARRRQPVKRGGYEPPKECDSDDDVPVYKKIKLESAGSDYFSSSSMKSDPSPLSLVKEEARCESAKRSSPFRPWDVDGPCSRDDLSVSGGYELLAASARQVQEEPLALVVEKRKYDDNVPYLAHRRSFSCESIASHQDTSIVHDLRTSQRPQEVVRIGEPEKDVHATKSTSDSGSCKRFASSSSTISSEEKRKSSQSSSHQRNYKNMTRERRIEANARERTRVHTISAAFETLRKCVPAYANNQKLSKLSVLRIACSYILTLSRMAGHDYSADQSAPSLDECVESVCNTIQMEGKTRKKKDE